MAIELQIQSAGKKPEEQLKEKETKGIEKTM